jgi:bacterioferritin-associated ferredoxin
MNVDRCVCRGCTFAELKRLHDAGADLTALQRQTGCGTSCGLCMPYIRLMLRTGRTRFHVSEASAANASDGAGDPSV